MHLEMSTVVRMMRMDGSGLDIRDRQWLKITIPNAFIGSELVDWLHNKVEGLQEKGYHFYPLKSCVGSFENTNAKTQSKG